MKKRNLLAWLFVVVTQTACAAFYCMDAPADFGKSVPSDFFKTGVMHE